MKVIIIDDEPDTVISLVNKLSGQVEVVNLRPLDASPTTATLPLTVKHQVENVSIADWSEYEQICFDSIKRYIPDNKECWLVFDYGLKDGTDGLTYNCQPIIESLVQDGVVDQKRICILTARGSEFAYNIGGNLKNQTAGMFFKDTDGYDQCASIILSSLQSLTDFTFSSLKPLYDATSIDLNHSYAALNEFVLGKKTIADLKVKKLLSESKTNMVRFLDGELSDLQYISDVKNLFEKLKKNINFNIHGGLDDDVRKAKQFLDIITKIRSKVQEGRRVIDYVKPLKGYADEFVFELHPKSLFDSDQFDTIVELHSLLSAQLIERFQERAGNSTRKIVLQLTKDYFNIRVGQFGIQFANQSFLMSFSDAKEGTFKKAIENFLNLDCGGIRFGSYKFKDRRIWKFDRTSKNFIETSTDGRDMLSHDMGCEMLIQIPIAVKR